MTEKFKNTMFDIFDTYPLIINYRNVLIHHHALRRGYFGIKPSFFFVVFFLKKPAWSDVTMIAILRNRRTANRQRQTPSHVADFAYWRCKRNPVDTNIRWGQKILCVSAFFSPVFWYPYATSHHRIQREVGNFGSSRYAISVCVYMGIYIY